MSAGKQADVRAGRRVHVHVQAGRRSSGLEHGAQASRQARSRRFQGVQAGRQAMVAGAEQALPWCAGGQAGRQRKRGCVSMSGWHGHDTVGGSTNAPGLDDRDGVAREVRR